MERHGHGTRRAGLGHQNLGLYFAPCGTGTAIVGHPARGARKRCRRCRHQAGDLGGYPPVGLRVAERFEGLPHPLHQTLSIGESAVFLGERSSGQYNVGHLGGLGEEEVLGCSRPVRGGRPSESGNQTSRHCLHIDGRDLELRDLGYRVQYRVGQSIGRRLRVMEGHEHQPW